MINNGTIYLSDFKKRHLQNGYKDRTQKNERIPVLTVLVIPGADSNATDLQFSWNVTKQNKLNLEIQLYFENPEKVSANLVSISFQSCQLTVQIPDQLKIVFNDPKIFVGINGKLMDSQSLVLQKYLPTQIYLSGTQAQIAAAVQSATSSAKIGVIGTFFINVVMSASLNQLWSMINTQQLIVLMPLFKVSMPANVQMFFNQLIKIATFNLINVAPTINKFLRLNETGALNPNFNALGFNSMYFMNNMGSQLIAFVAIFFGIIFLKIIDYFVDKKEWIAKLQMKLKDILFYNVMVETMMESYSQICVCCFIGLNKISFQSPGEAIQTLVNFFFFGLIFIFPITLIAVICVGWSRGKQNTLVQAFQSLFEELNTDRGSVIIIQPIYFLIRRFFMALLVVVFRNVLICQILLKAFSILIAITINSYIEPFKNLQKRRSEMINEIVIMIVMYNFICFSAFVPDIESRQKVGYLCILLVALHLLFNIFFIAKTSIDNLIYNIKVCRAKKKLYKQRNENKRKLKVLKEEKRLLMELNVLIKKIDKQEALQEKAGKTIKICTPLQPIPEEESDEEEEKKVNQRLGQKINKGFDFNDIEACLKQSQFGQLHGPDEEAWGNRQSILANDLSNQDWVWKPIIIRRQTNQTQLNSGLPNNTQEFEISNNSIAKKLEQSSAESSLKQSQLQELEDLINEYERPFEWPVQQPKQDLKQQHKNELWPQDVLTIKKNKINVAQGINQEVTKPVRIKLIQQQDRLEFYLKQCEEIKNRKMENPDLLVLEDKPISKRKYNNQLVSTTSQNLQETSQNDKPLVIQTTIDLRQPAFSKVAQVGNQSVVLSLKVKRQTKTKKKNLKQMIKVSRSPIKQKL